jgi:hypothetical protein
MYYINQLKTKRYIIFLFMSPRTLLEIGRLYIIKGIGMDIEQVILSN